jgi:hypothetical protein
MSGKKKKRAGVLAKKITSPHVAAGANRQVDNSIAVQRQSCHLHELAHVGKHFWKGGESRMWKSESM